MQTAVSVSARSLLECLDTHRNYRTRLHQIARTNVLLITTAEDVLADNRHSPASALPGDGWVWFWPLIVAEGSGGVEEVEGSLTATSPGSVRAHGGLHGCPAIRLFYTCSFSENTHTSLYGGSISRRSCGDSLIKMRS